MKFLSIGQRLTLWYVLIFAAAQLAFGAGMWFILRHNLYAITDHELKGQVEDLTRLLQAQKKKNTGIAKLQEEVTEAYVLEHSGDYLQLYVGDGQWIYRAPFLQQHTLPVMEPSLVNRKSYEDHDLGGKPFRFITQRVEANGRIYTAQSGVPIDQVLRTLSMFRRYLLMLAPVLLLAAAGGGYLLSRKALSPVDALTRTARTISGSNLGDRLETLHTGDELQRLSDTLNEMLARIETAFLRITQFTADASHELRTPISLIRAEAEIALQRLRSDGEYRDALRHILLEAERTSVLVEKLLTMARADSGSEVLEMRQFDLRASLIEVGLEWRRVASARGLQFKESIANRELNVSGDRAALQRVLSNLLDNAVKYTPSPGIIELCLEEKSGMAVVAVRDSGVGIADEDKPRIFERFYRADPARSRELGGAGLGLAIAHWIVQQHHGAITVESRPGVGSSFLLELPLQPAREPSAVAEALSA